VGSNSGAPSVQGLVLADGVYFRVFPDKVSAANTAPFKTGDPMPFPGKLGGFPPYDQSNLTPAAVNFRTVRGKAPPLSIAVLIFSD